MSFWDTEGKDSPTKIPNRCLVQAPGPGTRREKRKSGTLVDDALSACAIPQRQASRDAYAA